MCQSNISSSVINYLVDEMRVEQEVVDGHVKGGKSCDPVEENVK